VAAGEEVPLEPALALVLREHLHDAAVRGERVALVGGQEDGVPLLVGHLVGVLQAVGGVLVRGEHPEVGGIEPHDVSEPRAETPGGLGHDGTGSLHVHRVVPEVRQDQVLEDGTAVGGRVGTHAEGALRRELRDLGPESTLVVEQLLGPVAEQPVVELLEVGVGVACARQRHLVGAPRVLGALAVDLLGARPALRGAEDDHRPLGARFVLALGAGLDLGDLVQHRVEDCGEALVHLDDVLVVETADEEVRLVSVAAHEVGELLVGDAGEHGRVGDLVPVEVEDRQHHAVGLGVGELVRVPGRGQRAGLGLAVAHHGEREQVGVVEDGAVGVGQGVAEFATLVDGTGGLGGHVGGDAAGEAELFEQLPDAVGVLGDVRVDLGVGVLEVGVRDEAGAAVARSGDVDRLHAALLDGAVHVGVEEVQAGRRPPVAQQARLDVVAGQGLAEQGVVEQVDLADGEVVGRAPPGVDLAGLLVGDGMGLAVRPAGRHAHVRSCPRMVRRLRG